MNYLYELRRWKDFETVVGGRFLFIPDLQFIHSTGKLDVE